METAKLEFANLEKQMLDLQDKFMESSVHVMEETITGLGNENRTMQQKLKEGEMELEVEKEQKERVELRCNKLINENADLASNLAEVFYLLLIYNKQKLPVNFPLYLGYA